MFYSVTNSYCDGIVQYLNDYLVKQMEELTKYLNQLDFNEKVVIYGAGLSGKYIYGRLCNKENLIFCDKAYATIKQLNSIDVISPNELITKYNRNIIIIASGISSLEIYDFLITNKISNENIKFGIFVDEKEQYFDKILKFSNNETFLDIGGFDGMTSVNFCKNVNSKYNKIFIFEPDKNNQIKIEKNNKFQKLECVELLKIGAWNKKETLSFSSRSGESGIVETGDIEIDCDSIDNVLGDEPVTFIKMDIEGAELNALKGAKNIITKYKPKLAISIYHKPEDIIDIPLYIKSLVPEYKLYIRHYSTSLTETVLYAVID